MLEKLLLYNKISGGKISPLFWFVLFGLSNKMNETEAVYLFLVEYNEREVKASLYTLRNET